MCGREAGLLIAFEGLDGSGKTTACEGLARHLESAERNVKVVQWASFLGYEEDSPGQAFEPAFRAKKTGSLGPLAFSLWHCADFAHRWESEVQPALARGDIVIMDRFKYTAYVRDAVRGVDPTYTRQLYAFAGEPMVTFFLDVDPETALQRKLTATTRTSYYESGCDLFGAEDRAASFLRFQTLCREQYEKMLPKVGLLRVDASEPADRVLATLLSHIEPLSLPNSNGERR